MWISTACNVFTMTQTSVGPQARMEKNNLSLKRAKLIVHSPNDWAKRSIGAQYESISPPIQFQHISKAAKSVLWPRLLAIDAARSRTPAFFVCK